MPFPWPVPAVCKVAPVTGRFGRSGTGTSLGRPLTGGKQAGPRNTSAGQTLCGHACPLGFDQGLVEGFIETTVYEIHELPEAAKAPAQGWYILNVLNNDGHWYEAVFDDFQTICGILGITLRTRSANAGRRGGTTAGRPCIWFSGFSRQGDGASFEGTWEYAVECCRRVREHAPVDERLHELADALAAAQSPKFYEPAATITHQGRYSHEYCMQIEIDRNGNAGREPTEGSAEAVSEAMRDLRSLAVPADWKRSTTTRRRTAR